MLVKVISITNVLKIYNMAKMIKLFRSRCHLPWDCVFVNTVYEVWSGVCCHKARQKGKANITLSETLGVSSFFHFKAVLDSGERLLSSKSLSNYPLPFVNPKQRVDLLLMWCEPLCFPVLTQDCGFSEHTLDGQPEEREEHLLQFNKGVMVYNQRLFNYFTLFKDL